MVDSINGINPQVIIPDAEYSPRKVSTPNFRANEYNAYERTPDDDTFERSDNTAAKVSVGVLGGILASTAAIWAARKGTFGPKIQEFFGGARKAVEDAAKKGEDAAEDATKKAAEEVKKGFKDIYNDAVKNRESSVKNDITGRVHNFEYNKDGKLIKEIITKGDDQVIYENFNGRMRIVEMKKNGKITKRNLDKNGNVIKPESQKTVPEATKKTDEERRIEAGLKSPNKRVQNQAQRKADKRIPPCRRKK